MAEFFETVYDHVSGNDWCGVSTGEMALRNKLERLAEQFPDEVECIAKNDDGSVYYRIPWRWVRIQRPPAYTEAQKEMFRETLRDAREFKPDMSET